MNLNQPQQTLAKPYSGLTHSQQAASLSRSVVFYGALIYLALLLVPLSSNPIAAGVDPGWQYGLNSFWDRGVTFGRDVVFTYGPLGFIAVPERVGTNLIVGNAVRLLVWGLLLWQLQGLWRSGNHWQATTLTAGIILTNGLYTFAWEYFVVLVIVVLLVRLFEKPSCRVSFAVLGLLCGLLFLIKFSGFFLAAPAIILFAFHRLAKAPQKHLTGFVLPSLCILAGPVFYLLYNPSFVDLVRYIRGALSVSAGYSAAMGISMPDGGLRYLLALGLIFVEVLAYLIYRRMIPIATAGIALFMTWIVFKHGMVRCDAAHTGIFFLFSTLIFAFVVSLARLNPKIALILLVPFVAYSVLALDAASATFNIWRSSWWSPADRLAKLSLIWKWKGSARKLGATVGRSSDLSEEFAADVRGRRVLVLPNDLAYAHSFQFDLIPFFAMQAYSAYTPFLDRTSAAQIASNAPSIDRVLFDWKSIDGRHPILDLPATWITLFERFMVRRSTSKSLLLTHRKQRLELTHSTLSASEWAPGAWIKIPRRDDLMTATVDLSPELSGVLMTSLYKLPYVFLELRTLAGQSAKFRVVPSLLAFPFLVNALPLNGQQLVDLWERGLVRDPITEMRFIGDGLEYLHRGPIIFSALGGSDVIVPDQ